MTVWTDWDTACYGLRPLPVALSIHSPYLSIRPLDWWLSFHGIADYQCLSAKVLRSAFRAKCLSFVLLFFYLEKSAVTIQTSWMPTWQSYRLHHNGFAENKKARSKSNYHEYYIFLLRASRGRHRVEISFFAIQSNVSVLNGHPNKVAAW